MLSCIISYKLFTATSHVMLFKYNHKTLKSCPLPINYYYIISYNEITLSFELHDYEELLLLFHSPGGSFELHYLRNIT